MSWINILKRQEVAQTSQTGMAPIDILKPFKRVKDKGCYEKFVEMAKRVQASFPKSKEVETDVIVNRASRWHQANVMNFYYTEPNPEDNFYIHTAVKIPPKGDVPDEVYCRAIELYKSRARIPIIEEDIGEYEIQMYKGGDLHKIEIAPKGAKYQVPDTALILVAYYFQDDERFYEKSDKLNEKFDNWSGSL